MFAVHKNLNARRVPTRVPVLVLTAHPYILLREPGFLDDCGIYRRLWEGGFFFGSHFFICFLKFNVKYLFCSISSFNVLDRTVPGP